jgi:hypothetical protein
MPTIRRLSEKTLKRIETEAAEEAEAQSQIEAEGLAEIETISKTWGLAPEEAEVILRGKYLPLFIRARQAQRNIQKTGLTVSDHYGRSRVNPAAVVEKDSIAGMMRILKQLNIGMNEPPEPSPNEKPRPWSKIR